MEKLKLKRSVKIAVIILITILVFLVGLVSIFFYLKTPVDKSSNAVIEVDIKKGMSTANIAKILKEKELIRSELVFKITVKLNSKKTLKATVYELKKNMSLNEIIDILTEGNTYNPNVVRITFNEGENIKKYALKISKSTNNNYDDIISKLNDKNYISSLINSYWFLTEEINASGIYFPLEGYLSPNTYEFVNKDISVEEIIKTMLDQTDKELMPYKEIISNSSFTIHEYLTIASMLELEGTNSKNRKMIAAIFNNRLKLGMNLGSDVTTYYAFQEEMNKDLTAVQFSASNPYNTRAKDMGGKLPVGPICNPSLDSIEASFYPTANDYLFFVADKHGKVYYTKTEKEHAAKIAEIKQKGDWIW